MIFISMVQYRMVYVVRANKVFKCSRTFFGCGFDFVGGDGRESDALCGIVVGC